MLRHLIRRVRAFGSDRRGNVIILFGFMVIPMLLSIGLAVDYSRALLVKQRLASAIDAAALAVASMPNLSNQQLEEQAQFFFDANFLPGGIGTAGALSIVSNDEIVTISGNASVNTTIMNIVGYEKIDVAAFVEVTKKNKKLELVMVLDNTGSMGSSGKLDALKTAANTLLDVLFVAEQNGANNDDVKIGMVPFAAAVNIGADKLNSGWIDVNAQSSIAAEDFQPGTNVLMLYDNINNRQWNGCVRARPAPFDTQDTAPSVADPDTLWVPYLWPDAPDVGSYANTYASDAGYSGNYWDYDARQRYSGKYGGLTIPGWEDDGPDNNCRINTVLPLTSTRGDIESAINAMVATGSTVIPAGLAWGWRLISPTEPFMEGVAYDDEDTIKAIILLTDGRNSIGGGIGNHNHSYYSAYGFAQSGHVGATNGSQAESELDDKTATLCTNIKAQNIRLYTITFQLNNGPIKDLMRDCATKVSMYYDSPSNSELQTVFEEIGNNLSELRISQ